MVPQVENTGVVFRLRSKDGGPIFSHSFEIQNGKDRKPLPEPINLFQVKGQERGEKQSVPSPNALSPPSSGHSLNETNSNLSLTLIGHLITCTSLLSPLFSLLSFFLFRLLSLPLPIFFFRSSSLSPYFRESSIHTEKKPIKLSTRNAHLISPGLRLLRCPICCRRREGEGEIRERKKRF